MSENLKRGGFPKGVSPNPGGKPKIAKILDAMGLTTKTASVELMKFAFDVIRDSTSPLRDKIRMWEAVSPHILGKPKETIVLEDAGQSRENWAERSVEEKRELLELAARVGALDAEPTEH